MNWIWNLKTCAECEENYCKECFSAFHLKGALRKHHHLPYNVSKYIT